ncbi:nuclear envelope pore membrane protein POM 121-like [Pteropus medius]|uniref:nuclear envelope pore membrane protein POM 121-like n=1 Tax=Pteropus vampyrus TaxID=132908 RepID=UPI00196AEB56|nr:nuclear envelope pore membrane protein POM 121-like [Pteropus giganteus]
MGSYLSRPRSRPLSPALPGGDQRERPQRLGPVSPAHRLPPACRVHSRGPTLDLASPHCRRNHRRFVIVHRRQYPIQQTRCLFLGVFASVPRSSPQKPVLSACSCKMLCTSVILKMASAKGKLTLRLALKQTVVCMWSSLSGHLPNPGGKGTRTKALEQGCQLRAKEQQDPAALVGSGTGPAWQAEGYPVSERQAHQRRSPDGSGGTQSAFRRLVVNGVLSSFVPRPGPLRRDFYSKRPEGSLVKRPHTHFLSSCSKRNAISSSYSSTQGIPLLHSCRPSGAVLWGPASTHAQGPAEKAHGESQQPSSSATAEEQRATTQEKVQDVSSGQNLRSCLPSLDNSRPLKRKIPLLMPSKQGDPLILPPAPQLGYRVTTEDFDLEKKMALQWINKVLEG